MEGMHVDMDEGMVAQIFSGLGGPGDPPADEAPAAQTERLQRGYEAFMADQRNRSSPDGAVAFLRQLWTHGLLPQSSSEYLLDLMYGQTHPSRLRTGLPPKARLADKCGTAVSVNGLTAAYNDIGIITLPNGHTVLVAAFLTGSNASEVQRDQLFTDLARALVTTLH